MPGFVESAAGALLGGDDSGGDNAGGTSDDLLTGEASDGSPLLGDAQPFEYKEDSAAGAVTDLAARGVSEADEAECYAQYERELDECKLYSAMPQDSYTYLACRAQAFTNYNQCRGY
ncbi:hypothetical protein FAZ97_21315 [Paraburkholderia acidiphila]|uniref:Uncharacterized protein n=1 Tax=Paraburkholderia acidiphila TaxID=2571747 RepID=A0A7Z2G934_9BURK|nr:hypothetical protein FAZ97_21315 [Paraburkholderia acidiphila]